MNRWHIAELLFVIFVIIAVSWAVVAQQKSEFQPYANGIGGLTIYDLQQNETHSFEYNITNPNNVTVMIYQFLYTEPAELRSYVDFASTISNGTEIKAYQRVRAIFSLAVRSHSFENCEFYIKIGSFRKGIDYE